MQRKVDLRCVWDEEAPRWSQKPDADFETDDFLRLVRARCPDLARFRVLDIGCGPGMYAVPLARSAKFFTGCDISPRMVEAARERVRARGLSNAEFACMDFLEADLGGLGWKEAFDLVVSLNCPGLRTAESFARMSGCSRNLCVWQGWVSRSHPMHEAAQSAVGYKSRLDRLDISGQMDAFLKDSGVAFESSTRTWSRTLSKELDEAVAWSARRMPAVTRLDPATPGKIAAALRKFEKGGRVECTVTTRTRTVVWSVPR